MLIRAEQRPDLDEWTLVPSFMFLQQIQTLPLHFVEHFVLAAFGATKEEMKGLNVNLFDSFCRDCLVTTKMALKIMVAVERLLEAEPEGHWCWPGAQDAEAWSRLLEPAYPEGIPCTSIRLSIIMSDVERAHLRKLVRVPKVEALSTRHRTGTFTREDGDALMRVPASDKHARLHHVGTVPKFSPLHPTNLLNGLRTKYHPLLLQELEEKTMSRDASRSTRAANPQAP